MPLRQAHDIGESLQNRMEEMEEVGAYTLTPTALPLPLTPKP